jgi:hypothetical protein
MEILIESFSVGELRLTGVQKAKSAVQVRAFMGAREISCRRERPASAAGTDLRRSSRCHNQIAFLALVGEQMWHFTLQQ